MREDMDKIVVERPRFRGYETSKRRYNEISKQTIRSVMNDPDSFDEQNGAEYKYDRNKSFNDHTMPLYRFLLKNVGRPWNSVYSELRERISPKSTTQMHILQHVRGWVETNTCLGPNGEVQLQTGRIRNLDEQFAYGDHKIMYVHPTTGILCKTDGKKRGQQENERAKTFKLDDFHQFRNLNGVWVLVELEVIPQKEGKTDRFSWGNGDGIPPAGNKFYGFTSRYNYSKVSDILFPEGINDHRRGLEYGYCNMKAKLVRSPGKRELKKLAAFLRAEGKKKN